MRDKVIHILRILSTGSCGNLSIDCFIYRQSYGVSIEEWHRPDSLPHDMSPAPVFCALHIKPLRAGKGISCSTLLQMPSFISHLHLSGDSLSPIGDESPF